MQYTSVTSKFKPLILFFLVFMLVVLFFLIILLQTEPEIIVFLVLFISFVVYGFVKIVANHIYFKIDTRKITYGFGKTQQLSDIKEMILYDNVITKMLFLPFPEEAVTLVFKDGSKVSFKDNYYRNLWKLRFFLERKTIKKESIPKFNYKTKFENVTIENKTTPIPFYIKILPYVALLSLVLFIISITYSLFKEYIETGYIMINFMFLFFYLIFGTQTSYIESSKDFIVIKSLFFPFYKKVIPVNQIRYVSKDFEILGRGGRRNFLKIYTVYHKKERVSIDFIRSKREENIINQFKKLGINYYDNSSTNY